MSFKLMNHHYHKDDLKPTGVSLGESKGKERALLPLWFVEPTVIHKRKQLAFSHKGKPGPELDMTELKNTLIGIRNDSLEHFSSFEKKLKRNLGKKDNVNFVSASTGLDAIDYISDIFGSMGKVAINNSSTVREIMAQLPPDTDLNFFDSYSEAVRWSVGVEVKDDLDWQKTGFGYWNIPSTDPVQIWNSFSVEPSTKGYYRSQAPYIPGEYGSLMGVNCISAEGDLFLVQHLQNISNILSGSKIAVFIIGLEKLVRGYEQGLLQSRCTALFGYETILLDMFSRPDLNLSLNEHNNIPKTRSRSRKTGLRSRDDTDPYFEFGLPPEIHVILLDNGRRELLDSGFKDILKCISCKACSRLCPRTRYDPKTSLNARDIIMASFINGLEYARDNGLFNCTLCRNCHDVCPVDIPLHEYLLKLRSACEKEGIMPGVHERIYDNIMNFNTPYGQK